MAFVLRAGMAVGSSRQAGRYTFAQDLWLGVLVFLRKMFYAAVGVDGTLQQVALCMVLRLKGTRCHVTPHQHCSILCLTYCIFIAKSGQAYFHGANKYGTRDGLAAASACLQWMLGVGACM